MPSVFYSRPRLTFRKTSITRKRERDFRFLRVGYAVKAQ